MKIEFQTGQPLDRALGPGSLFSQWLAGARAELQQTLEGKIEQGPAPFFDAASRQESFTAWMENHLADLPGSRDRSLFRGQLEQLQAGTAGVVVTGQQPGDLGGPFYTLLKVATTVALARTRTRQGRPTVPVFWSGDDDDDLAEAQSARAFDPIGARLFTGAEGLAARYRQSRPRPCVGEISCAAWSTGASRWLNGQDLRPYLSCLGLDLAGLWDQACGQDWNWARLQRRFLLRTFSGTGLVVVSGNDPILHGAAAPLYREILDRREELASLVVARGQELVAAGHPLPISTRSAYRHLYLTEGHGRVPLAAGTSPERLEDLRPGVVLRSPVQDWLLRPSAVVVGPGELAYLRQLDPVYKALGLPRCPLAPRTFGWVIPRGLDPALLTGGAGSRVNQDLAERLARQAGGAVEENLAGLLQRELGVDPQRAGRLAEGRARRWQRSVRAMVRAEIERQERAGAPRDPAWVFSGPGRQERSLASLFLAVFWGDDLIGAFLEASGDHLAGGLQGRWRDYLVQVNDLKGDPA
jgi:hypothetical protein